MIKNRILVTGGAGFIGSHLCSRLLNEDNEVICLDNFFTGSKDNVKNLLKDENFKIIEHNIIDPIDLKVDQIYNLASPASPVHYQSDPVNTIKTNVNGAINVLEIARKYGAKILRLPHPKYMVILRSILSQKVTLAASTPLDQELVMTKVKERLKHYSLIIIGNIRLGFELLEFLIHMVPIWKLMMAGLFLILLHRL